MQNTVNLNLFIYIGTILLLKVGGIQNENITFALLTSASSVKTKYCQHLKNEKLQGEESQKRKYKTDTLLQLGQLKKICLQLCDKGASLRTELTKFAD